MLNITYAEATNKDFQSLGKLRATNSADKEYWATRIAGYLNFTVNPQQALRPRIIYTAWADNSIIGFIAGHLTHRFECDGELQWIDVIQEYRRNKIASELVKILAKWFTDHKSYKICVDPGNEIAKTFYKANGAEYLNEHWMFWNDIRTIFR